MTIQKKQLLYFFTLLLALAGCFERVPEEIRNRALETATFDTAIIARLDKYLVLKDFLEANTDTLIKYRDAEYHKHYSPDDSSLTGKPTNNSYYMFDEVSRQLDMPFLPGHLIATADSICEIIVRKNLNSFFITREKDIGIVIKVDGSVHHAIQRGHMLIWNKQVSLNPHLDVGNKDTLLRNNCIYRINITEFWD